MATEPTLSSTTAPVEVASALYDALSKRDVDAVLKIDADDAVGDVVAIGEFRGKPAIRQFLDELFQAFPEHRSLDRPVEPRVAYRCPHLSARGRKMLQKYRSQW